MKWRYLWNVRAGNCALAQNVIILFWWEKKLKKYEMVSIISDTRNMFYTSFRIDP